jgi:hypothetical protein
MGYPPDYDRKVWIGIFCLRIGLFTFQQGFTVDARLSHFATGYDLGLNFA